MAGFPLYISRRQREVIEEWSTKSGMQPQAIVWEALRRLYKAPKIETWSVLEDNRPACFMINGKKEWLRELRKFAEDRNTNRTVVICTAFRMFGPQIMEEVK